MAKNRTFFPAIKTDKQNGILKRKCETFSVTDVMKGFYDKIFYHGKRKETCTQEHK